MRKSQELSRVISLKQSSRALVRAYAFCKHANMSKKQHGSDYVRQLNTSPNRPELPDHSSGFILTCKHLFWVI
jgi:hypothetical protein